MSSTKTLIIVPLISDSISLNNFIASTIPTTEPVSTLSPTLTNGSFSGLGFR